MIQKHLVRSFELAVMSMVLLVASGADASIITYNDEATFLGALPGAAQTENFDSLAPGTQIPSGGTVGGTTFVYDIPPESLLVTDAYDTISLDNSLGLTGGDDALLAGDEITMLFSQTFAVGLWVITSPDEVFAGDILLSTSEGTATNSASFTALPDGGQAYFIGIISDLAFSSVALHFDPLADGAFIYNVDSITTAVPEPTSLALFGIGLVGLTWTGRRRNRRV